MQTYQYVNTEGQTQSIQAANPQLAMSSATNKDPSSGVQLMPQLQQTTTQQTAQTNERMLSLDQKNQTIATGNVNQSQLSPEMQEYFKNNPQALNGKPLDPNATNTPPKDPNSLDSKYDLSGQTNTLTAEAKARVQDITDTLDRVKSLSNQANANLIASIRQIYGARIQKMEESNRRLKETTRAVGIRQGRGRYAPTMQQGIITAEEERGHERIAELEGAMLGAIAQAEQSRADGDLKIFNAQFDMIDKIEKKLNDEIQQLFKRAVDTENTIRQKEREEREAKKAQLEMDLKTAATAAPALLKSMTGMTTDQQMKFLSAYSLKTGISEEILLGELEGASQKNTKALLDIENIKNTIYNRNRSTQNSINSTGLQYQKFNEEQNQKTTTNTLRSKILENLQARSLTKDQALDVWVTGGGSIAEFNKEFAEF